MENHLANARYIIGLLAIVSLTAVSAHGAEMSCEAVGHYPPAAWSPTALPTQLSDAGYSNANDPYDLTDIQTLARDPKTGNLTCTAMIHVAGNRWSFTHWLAPYEGRVTFQVKTLVPPVRLPPNMPSPPPVTLTTDTPATLEFLPEVTPTPTVSETAPDGSRRVVLGGPNSGGGNLGPNPAQFCASLRAERAAGAGMLQIPAACSNFSPNLGPNPARPVPAAENSPVGQGRAPAAAPVPVPAPINPALANLSPMFRKGLADRTDWENWFTAQTGDFKAGAEFWAGQRRLLTPQSCHQGSEAFQAGCTAAIEKLAGADVLRKSETRL